jgi:uncharacterized protein (DUF4213/DUF364 family)
VSIIEALPGGLHIDAPVRQVSVGAFWTAVVWDTTPPRCGLASTLHGVDYHDGPPVPRAGHLLEQTEQELARWLRSSSILEASIGMATVNALLQVDEAACIELNAADLIVEQGTGRRVAIVGHFPFVQRVRQAGDVLPQADVVALTGTSLINHTLEGLIDLCRADAFVMLLGASAPLLPVLFEYQADAVSGTRVVGIPAVLEAVTQGGERNAAI